jgi:hypothetical protein
VPGSFFFGADGISISIGWLGGGNVPDHLTPLSFE